MIQIVRRFPNNKIEIMSDNQDMFLDIGVQPVKRLIIYENELRYVEEITLSEKEKREENFKQLFLKNSDKKIQDQI